MNHSTLATGPKRRLPRILSNVSVLAPIALLAILVIAFLLRLYGIATESLWLDEATSLMLARKDLGTLIQWTQLDIHPPLYYILLHYWIALGQSEAVVRGLSVLAGVLTVLVIYELGRTLFDQRTGFFAAALLAVAPVHVWYSQEARMYAWVTLLSAASVLLALKAWRRPRWINWLGYVLVTAAALYTHYYAAFAILIENLFFLYLLLRQRRKTRFFWTWVASQVATLVLFLPWLPTFLLPLRAGGGGWVTVSGGKTTLGVLAQTAVLYMVGTVRELYPAAIRRFGYILFVAVLAAGLWPRRARRNDGLPQDSPATTPLYTENDAMGFVVVWLVLPLSIVWVGSQLLKPMYSTRYMLPFLIPFVLLAARGIRNIPAKVAQGAVLVLLVGFMGIGVAAQVKVLEKPDWRTWSAKVVAASQPGDLVLFVPGWHAGAFDYYAHGALPLSSDVPVPVPNYGQAALEAVDKAVAGHPRVWLIWETDHYTDPKGAVYSYLRSRCRLLNEMQMPELGTISLFENCAEKGSS